MFELRKEKKKKKKDFELGEHIDENNIYYQSFIM